MSRNLIDRDALIEYIRNVPAMTVNEALGRLVIEWIKRQPTVQSENEEELKELRKYRARMELQFIDDIDNPLEPLKLSSALASEIRKYEWRKENKPKSISVLDYTIMYALAHCLEEQVCTDLTERDEEEEEEYD